MQTLNFFLSTESQRPSIISLYKALDEKHAKTRVLVKSFEEGAQKLMQDICRTIILDTGSYLTLGLISPWIGFKKALALGTIVTMSFDAKLELNRREQKFLNQVRQLRNNIHSRVLDEAKKKNDLVYESNFENGVNVAIYKGIDLNLIDEKVQWFFEKEIETTAFPQLGFVSASTDPAFWSSLLNARVVAGAVLVSFGALISQIGIYTLNRAVTS
ncbi:MAG: hypothetical protein S4CHLAM6_13790 [Chlamydiae bacterium]|nr:hypothetical protein [Chlamydiota bacterium]